MISINCKIKINRIDKYKETIDKIRELASKGITKVIITEMYDDDNIQLNIEETKEIVNYLNEICEEERIFIDIYSGSLIELQYDGEKKFLSGIYGTLNETPYILLKVGEEISNQTIMIVKQFIKRNTIPIISAPENIEHVKANPKAIEYFAELGCLFQLDINSLYGKHGRKSKKVAKYLLKKGFYDFLEVEDKSLLKKLSKKQRITFRKNSINLLKSRYISSHKFQVES